MFAEHVLVHGYTVSNAQLLVVLHAAGAAISILLQVVIYLPRSIMCPLLSYSLLYKVHQWTHMHYL
jgi:hypothetical protein